MKNAGLSADEVLSSSTLRQTSALLPKRELKQMRRFLRRQMKATKGVDSDVQKSVETTTADLERSRSPVASKHLSSHPLESRITWDCRSSTVSASDVGNDEIPVTSLLSTVSASDVGNDEIPVTSLLSPGSNPSLKDEKPHLPCPAEEHIAEHPDDHSLCVKVVELQAVLFKRILTTEAQFVRHMRSVRQLVERHTPNETESPLRSEYLQLEKDFLNRRKQCMQARLCKFADENVQVAQTSWHYGQISERQLRTLLSGVKDDEVSWIHKQAPAKDIKNKANKAVVRKGLRALAVRSLIHKFGVAKEATVAYTIPEHPSLANLPTTVYNYSTKV